MALRYEPEELQFKKIYKVPDTIIGFYDKTPETGPLSLIALLDTETTGLDTASAEIIEIGYMLIEVDDNGKFYDVVKRFNQLQQPSEPLPAKITEVTGLTDADLAGHAIDWDQVNADLASVSLIVAHNAGFDRKMMERYSPVCVEKLWGCSINDIDWASMGQGIRNQEWLVYNVANCHYNAHRAIDDVNALSLLLSRHNPETGEYLFKQLNENAQHDLKLIKATGSDFSEKDALKQAGYRWNGDDRVWAKSVTGGEFEARKDELKEELMTAAPSCNPTVATIPALNRYSVRAE